MIRIITFLFAIGFIFSSTHIAIASEGHDESKSESKSVGEATDVFRNGSSSSLNENTEHTDSHPVGEADDHATNDVHSEGAADDHATDNGHSEGEADDHSTNDAHSDSEGETDNHATIDAHSEGADDHATDDGHSDEEAEHAEEADAGHHGPVVETPPNFKVLGSFGAVNLSFILIGIWNKWIRRKGA